MPYLEYSYYTNKGSQMIQLSFDKSYHDEVLKFVRNLRRRQKRIVAMEKKKLLQAEGLSPKFELGQTINLETFGNTKIKMREYLPQCGVWYYTMENGASYTEEVLQQLIKKD